MKKSKLELMQVALAWLIVAVSFIFAAGYLVLNATGYKFSSSNWQVQKTVLLRFISTPRDALIYINGELTDKSTPARLAGMSPDYYDIKIEKQGYEPWIQSFLAEEGLAYDFNYIVLFLTQPKVESADINLVNSLSEIGASRDIFFEDGEIWYKDKLVTRLSKDIENAVVYPDHAHIAFQVGNEIRIVEIETGTNNTLLVKLNDSKPTKFGFQGGDTLIFIDGDLVKRAQIL